MIPEGTVNPITAIDEAVEARLRTAFLANRWSFQRVPDPMTLDEFKRLMRATPWLGLGWTDLAASPQGRQVQGQLSFSLTICVKNVGHEARFHGDRQGPGLYVATMVAAALLHGMTIRDVGTIQVTRAASAFAEGFGDASIAIARLTFQVTTSLGDFLGAVAQLPELKELISGWDLAASSGDQAEDAPADTITFDQEEAAL